jgi:hypothetical protein
MSPERPRSEESGLPYGPRLSVEAPAGVTARVLAAIRAEVTPEMIRRAVDIPRLYPRHDDE